MIPSQVILDVQERRMCKVCPWQCTHYIECL